VTKRWAVAWVGLLAAAGLGAFYFPGSKQFISIDRCLDSGGSWNYRHRSCQSAPSDPIDMILVDKSSHRMMAFRNGRLVREFRVALGKGGLAPKRLQGDGRVPEGVYRITFHNAASQYHRSLRIGYPTLTQAEAARQAGVDPGSDIMIHGLRNGMGLIGSRHVMSDWTAGCIAVTNQEMDWLFDAVPDATPIEIRA